LVGVRLAKRVDVAVRVNVTRTVGVLVDVGGQTVQVLVAV
jgi:hypothetical protein